MSLKNIIKSTALMLAMGGSLASCSDMLETESTRQTINPSIGSKTDSVFYAYGILQAMQQLADQYVFQGEMRGDLVKTTVYTDKNLQQLASFSASTSNKYNTPSAYYLVINNCNYYIAHCDTTLSRDALLETYRAAKAIRAWAYLQLGRNYERVPFFTTPLTAITQIDGGHFPELDLAGLVNELAPDLEQYSGMTTPSFGYVRTNDGYNYFEVGSPNWSSRQKRVSPHYLFVPIDVVLGDMYLETNQYEKAAQHYVTYLTKVASRRTSPYIARMVSKNQNTGRFGAGADEDLPNVSVRAGQNNSGELPTTNDWKSIFAENSMNDLVTYVPMAVSRENGYTTDVPLAFGFNYYATSEEKERVGGLSDPYVEAIQLLPSDVLNTLSDSTEFYYYASHNPQSNPYDSINIARCGDMRLRSIITQATVGDSTMQWINKYKFANIVLYRRSTVLLHLAEAFNRMEMPDAAFAILKDGLSGLMLYLDYMTPATLDYLQRPDMPLSEENVNKFPIGDVCGIHCHGAGKAASDLSTSGTTVTYIPGVSPYTLNRMTGLKMQEIARQYGVAVGTTKQDTINAVEDMLCDEYALEFAFEGNRYYDLMRLARHKNALSPAGYPADFGYLWLGKKLEGRGWSQSTMYLPYK